jgi:hypothetical protein
MKWPKFAGALVVGTLGALGFIFLILNMGFGAS